MKKKIIFSGILIFCSVFIFEIKAQNNLPVQKGVYLGQKPPGMTPEIFAPGIVSIEEGKEYKIAFSPDLKEIFFTRRTPRGRNDRNWYCRFENGKLTTPKLAPFTYDCLESNACFTPDGKRVYFSSRRPLPGEEALSKMPNIWFVDKTEAGWSKPQFLGSPLNDLMPVYFSFENSGTLYFTRSRPREIGSAEWKNGRFSNIKSCPDEINYVRDVAHPAVAPDGSYIIVDSYYFENNRLTGSLYISFRKPDGSWTKAVSMKNALKASESDIYASARVTPDGKYILFEKYIREFDKADIYWVDARIIDDLRPKQ